VQEVLEVPVEEVVVADVDEVVLVVEAVVVVDVKFCHMINYWQCPSSRLK
jgi:hypothetical protein